MALKSVGDLSARMVKMETALTGADMKQRIQKLGVELKPYGEEAARGDLGSDGAFSGWKSAGPLQVAFKLHGDGRGLTMHRAGRSAGPWRVAQSGRNQGNAGGFAGPGINTKTGETARTKSGALRKQRGRKGRRWNGRTEGKGTWDKAVKNMDGEARKRFSKINREAVMKAFKG